jgi:uncharacterized membrane protein YdjX (TVP38/TMEM64 family)
MGAPQKKELIFRLAVAAVIVALLVLSSKYLHFHELLTNALEWVSGLGMWGPVIFIIIYIVACVLFIPGTILTLGAGVIFGVVKGSVIVSVSATLGATVAFLVGRYLARDWVAGKVEGNQKFKAIDDAVAREGWKIVGLTRLSRRYFRSSSLIMRTGLRRCVCGTFSSLHGLG